MDHIMYSHIDMYRYIAIAIEIENSKTKNSS